MRPLLLVAILAPMQAWGGVIQVPGARNVSFERFSRNLVTQSEAFGTAPWTIQNLTAALPVVTANVADCPRPGVTGTADRVAFPDVASAQYSMVWQNIGVLAVGDKYALSFWARAVSGSSTITFALSDFTPAGSLKFTQVITTSWAKYSVPVTIPSAATRYVLFGTDARAGNTNMPASSATTYEVCGFQLERGVSSTSYIPTAAAAVSRSARNWR